MPFRHAGWALLLLVPMIAVAFWPQYLHDLPHAAFALHAHGLTAALWIALVFFQHWSIHQRRNALHRTAGLAVLGKLYWTRIKSALGIKSKPDTIASEDAARSDHDRV